MSVFLTPVILNQANWLWFPQTQQWWMPNGIASFLGALLGCYPFEHEIFPQLDFKKWRHQVVAGWGIRFGIWTLLIAGIVFMPEVVEAKMALVALLYLLVHLAIQWGLFLRYLRWVKFARPASNHLAQLVADASAKMGISPKATWQLSGPYAAAFAFPTTRELVFSDRLLEVCTDEEVFSVCCHELAHLSESKAVLAGRLLGSLAIFPLIFIVPCIHYFDWPGMIIPYLALFIISRFARWLSQRMEKRADQMAMDRQANEGVYARALEKLYRESQIPAVNVNSRQTHPHLYDRMLAAGISPDYPRPSKPKRLTLFGWLYAFFFLAS